MEQLWNISQNEQGIFFYKCPEGKILKRVGQREKKKKMVLFHDLVPSRN